MRSSLANDSDADPHRSDAGQRRLHMTPPIKVLVVEDDAPTLAMLCAVVSSNGMSATPAADGAQALALLQRDVFDVVLLDLLLPQINGFEVLHHLKTATPRGLQSVVVVTTAAERAIRYSEDLREVFAFFRKPIDINELCAKVQECAAHAAA